MSGEMTIKLNEVVSAKFLKTIKEAPIKGTQAIKTALFRCGTQLMSDAKTMAPHDTGDLFRSITMAQPNDKTVTVGSNKVYAQIQDQGGTIEAKNADYLTFKVNGQWVRVKKVTIPAHPYLTPAFQKVVDVDAQRIFGEEISRIFT